MRQDKKQAVMGNKDKSSGGGKLIAVIVVLLAVAAGGVYVYLNTGAGAADSNQTATSGPGKIISLAAADFDDGKARHFSYKASEDIEIRFFVLKSSDGVIRAAFDACDVCWRSGKGYVQSGDTMICRNCGQRFASVKVNEVRGGCNPSPLDRRVENGKVIITVANLMTGAKYFNFKTGVTP